MALFGSKAREEDARGSYVDIMVEFKDRIGIRFVDLADEIESLLNQPAPEEHPVYRNRHDQKTQRLCRSHLAVPALS